MVTLTETLLRAVYEMYHRLRRYNIIVREA